MDVPEKGQIIIGLGFPDHIDAPILQLSEVQPVCMIVSESDF